MQGCWGVIYEDLPFNQINYLYVCFIVEFLHKIFPAANTKPNQTKNEY